MGFSHRVQLILTALFWNTRFYTRLYPHYHTERPTLDPLLGLVYPWPVRVVIWGGAETGPHCVIKAVAAAA